MTWVGSGRRAVYCVQSGLQWIAPPGIGPTYPAPLKLTGLMRAEVRVLLGEARGESDRQLRGRLRRRRSPRCRLSTWSTRRPRSGRRHADEPRRTKEGASKDGAPTRLHAGRAHGLARRGPDRDARGRRARPHRTTTFYEGLGCRRPKRRPLCGRAPSPGPHACRVHVDGKHHARAVRHPTVPCGQKIAHSLEPRQTSRYGALTNNLQGIRINVGGSLLGQANLLSGANGLNPDSII